MAGEEKEVIPGLPNEFLCEVVESAREHFPNEKMHAPFILGAGFAYGLFKKNLDLLPRLQEAIENSVCEQTEKIGIRCRKNQTRKCERCSLVDEMDALKIRAFL